MPESINNRGEATGFYYTSITPRGVTTQSFIRDHRGTLTTFDPPGSTSSGARAINNRGEVTGTYTDVRGGPHGFMRDPRGTITTFDVPGSTYSQPLSINEAGAVTGYYSDGFTFHGFIRNAH